MTTELLASRPGDVARQLTGRDYLSYSAISSYQTCPLRYFFRYVEGLPEDTVSSSLAFGSGVHAAMEYWFNEQLAGNPPPDHDQLLGAFWDAWRCKNEEATISFAKGEDASTVGQLADRVLRVFIESEVARPAGTVIGVEEQLRGAIIPDTPDLLARIDLLVEAEDTVVVTDFKTARSRWSEAQADDQAEQLLLYGELAKRLAPGKQLRLEFAVVTKTKTPVVERHAVTADSQRIERTKRVVQRVWRAIESGHFYPAPSPMNCPGCPFREPCRSWSG